MGSRKIRHAAADFEEDSDSGPQDTCSFMDDTNLNFLRGSSNEAALASVNLAS